MPQERLHLAFDEKGDVSSITYAFYNAAYDTAERRFKGFHPRVSNANLRKYITSPEIQPFFIQGTSLDREDYGKWSSIKLSLGDDPGIEFSNKFMFKTTHRYTFDDASDVNAFVRQGNYHPKRSPAQISRETYLSLAQSMLALQPRAEPPKS